MKVDIKIYLNDGEDHFMGFRNNFANNPELTLVHKFQVEVPAPNVHQILDWCFTEFNVGTSGYAMAYRAKQLRSLSVGDVVTVGEGAWACEPAAWVPITTQELNNAVINEDV